MEIAPHVYPVSHCPRDPAKRLKDEPTTMGILRISDTVLRDIDWFVVALELDQHVIDRGGKEVPADIRFCAVLVVDKPVVDQALHIEIESNEVLDVDDLFEKIEIPPPVCAILYEPVRGRVSEWLEAKTG